MADFRLGITLNLEDQITSSLGKIKELVGSTFDTLEKGAQRAVSRMDRLNESMKGVAKSGLALGAVGLETDLIVAATVRPFLDFDASMSAVGAKANATADELSELRKQVRDLGATTKFSATQAASGMEFLAQAGFKQDEIISAMPPLLDLAAAGNLELARAADITSNVMGAYSLSASEAGRVSNVLAKTATSANTNVEMLGQAFKFAAPSANALGISVESTAAAFGVLGDQGIQATMGGTGLISVFRGLMGASGESQKMIEKLGLEFFDAEEGFVGITNAVRQLDDATKDLSEQEKLLAFQKIFRTEGSKIALGLTNQIEKLGELEEANFAAAGSANALASVMADNLKGDLTTFGSALESVRISITEASNDQLRFATQSGTAMLRFLDGAINKFPTTAGAIFSFTGGLGAAFSVVSPFLIALPDLVMGIGFLAKAFKLVAVGVRIFSAALWANPIFLIIGAVTALVFGFAAWKNGLSGVVGVFKTLWGIGKMVLGAIVGWLTMPIRLVGKLAEGIAFLTDMVGITDGAQDRISGLFGKVNSISEGLIGSGFEDTKEGFQAAFGDNASLAVAPLVSVPKVENKITINQDKNGNTSVQSSGTAQNNVQMNTGMLLSEGF